VGVFRGHVTKITEGAERVMVVSTGSIVAGADPGEQNRADYSLVAFVGQADVRVRGPVNSGDLLLPSGDDDGTAIAIAPTELALAQVGEIVGQAWENNPEPDLKPVRTLVGLVQPAAMSTALQSFETRLEAVEARLGPTD
jgi:hypothetical protein